MTYHTKSFIALSAAALVIGLSGCSSAKKMVAAVPDCTFDDGTTPAPAWVCPPHPVDGYTIVAVGSHKKNSAGLQFSVNQATLQARATMATNIKSLVEASVKNTLTQTGAADDPVSTDGLASTTSQLFTSETLSGTKAIKQAISPTGVVFILVGSDEKLLEQTIKNKIRTSMNNNAAMWQKFQGKKSFDELSSDIAARAVKSE